MSKYLLRAHDGSGKAVPRFAWAVLVFQGLSQDFTAPCWCLSFYEVFSHLLESQHGLGSGVSLPPTL